MVRAAELRDLADQELLTRLSETKQELFNLRFQLATGQLDNHSRLGEVRRDIARIRTVIRQREIAGAEALEAAEGATTDTKEPDTQEPATEETA